MRHIDVGFNVGDDVCYLSDDRIFYTKVRKVVVEMSNLPDEPDFVMFYKLTDGMTIVRNNYPEWNKRLFANKESLIKYLEQS